MPDRLDQPRRDASVSERRRAATPHAVAGVLLGAQAQIRVLDSRLGDEFFQPVNKVTLSGAILVLAPATQRCGSIRGRLRTGSPTCSTPRGCLE